MIILFANLMVGIWFLLQCDSISTAAINCGRCVRGDSLLCPNYIDKQFEVRLDSDPQNSVSFLAVICSSDKNIDFSLLDGCNFSSVNEVKFKFCPLTNESIASTLKIIGVSPGNIESLSIFYPLQTVPSLKSTFLAELANLTFLDLDSTGLYELSEGVFESTPNLETLHLIGNNLTLNSNIFRPLYKLQVLNLSQNYLSYIPKSLFDPLKRLKSLYLWSNKITTFPPNIFDELTLLQNLTLLSNELVSLDNDLFRFNSELYSVNFRKNKLTHLPDNLFRNCSKLNSVKVGNNFIENIPESLFENISSLQEIEACCNKLESLPEKLFSTLPSLKSVHFMNNFIKSLPGSLFKANKKLEEINFSNNQIKNLTTTLFNHIIGIRSINLNNNSIDNIPEYMFASCYALEELLLNRNNISFLNFISFPRTSESSSLKMIDLSHNKLNSSSISKDYIFALNAQLFLESIDLSYNQFTSLPTEAHLYNYAQLKFLNFEGNFLSGILLSDILHLPSGSVFILKNNNISTFVVSTTYENKYVNVYLEGNNFTCDCYNYNFVKMIQSDPAESARLSYYSLSHNGNGYRSDHEIPHVAVLVVKDKEKLKCQRPEFLGEQPLLNVDTSLMTCAFDSTKCQTECPCIIRPFDDMVIVDCAERQMTRMPNITKLFPKFNYTLDMTSNQISTFDLLNYTVIVNLSLSDNHLTSESLSNSTLLPPNLRFLDLRRNNLTYLNQGFIHQINATGSKVDFTENPWVCDCAIKDLYNFIQIEFKKVWDIENVVCDGGDRSLRLMDLRKEDVCPLLLQPMVLTTIVVITALLLLFAVLGTVSFYRYKTRIKVWLFTHRMFMWLVTEDELDVDKQYDAFISYSHKDEDFVENILVPGLENGDPKYTVCLHFRDWIIGECIQSQILDSVQSSRRTLVVLSKSFIDSIWGQMEFRAAHQQALQDNTNRVIVIVYGEMPASDQLDEELRHYVALHTYLKWDDNPRFWESLRYAMPHPQHLLKKKKRRDADRLELKNGIVSQGVMMNGVSMDMDPSAIRV